MDSEVAEHTRRRHTRAPRLTPHCTTVDVDAVRCPWHSGCVIIHLLGFPGVGKHTIAGALSQQAAANGRHLVVVDNHLTSQVVLSVIGADGIEPLPDRVWDRVREIREIVYSTIETLSPPHLSFVFTNVLVVSDLRSLPVIERLQRLAQTRSTAYVPVMLSCDTAEHQRRVPSPGRSEKLKWIDPDGVAAFVTAEELLRPSTETMDLDVTALTPTEAAERIMFGLVGAG